MITKKVEAKAPGRQGLHGREPPLGERENPRGTWEAPGKMKAKIKLVTKGSTYLQKTTHRRFTPKRNIRETRKMRSTDMGYEILKCQSIF